MTNDPTKNPHGKYNGNELKYITQLLDSENPDNKRNPFSARLEKAVAGRFGRKYAIAHNSGTSTLHSCLAAAGVGAGDEVICPAQSVLMNPAVVLWQNGIPVFADMDPATFNLDPKDVEKKITKKTKAIFAVHMHGLPVDMDPIMALAHKYNIVVIEDSAQCMLGKYKGRLAGSIGHMASFSFESKKHLSTGEGGMVVTDDENLGRVCRRTAFNGYRTLEAGQGLRQLLPSEFQDPNYKRYDTLGLNYRMNEFTAAIGLAQFERVETIVARRQKVASYFKEALDGCDWVIPQQIPDGHEHSYYTFSVKYHGDDKYGITWKEFYNAYKENGGDGFYGGVMPSYLEPMIADRVFIKSGYLPADAAEYAGRFNYEKGLCPIAESVQPRMMSFKTNYRNLELAKTKAQALRKTVQDISGTK